MTENDRTSHAEPQVEPALRGLLEQPKGVSQKNLKMFVYLGAAVLVIAAAIFSSAGKKRPGAGRRERATTATHLQDNTDNNVQDLKNQLLAERQKAAAGGPCAAAARSGACVWTPAQQAAAAAFGPSGEATTSCVPGQPCAQAQQGTMPQQLTPQSSNKSSSCRERARAGRQLPLRFEPRVSRAPSNGTAARKVRRCPSSMTYRAAAQRRISLTHRLKKNRTRQPGGYKRPLEANIDSAVGQPYLVYEGSVLDTV